MEGTEHLVKKSMVFVLYFSKGYFYSKARRRVVNAAIKYKRPILLLLDGKDNFISLSEFEFDCMKGYEDDDFPLWGRML